MKKNNVFKIVFTSIFILSLLFSISIPALATEEVTVRNYSYILINAEVDEKYPDNHVDVIIKDEKGNTVKELTLLDITMYSKKITLDSGTYTLTGVNPVDAKKFPIESVNFSVTSPYDTVVEFRVGPIEKIEETTVPSADVVEKETTEKVTEEKPSDSFVSIEDPNNNETLNNASKIIKIIVFVTLGIFALLAVVAIVIYIRVKKKNEQF